jgi:hypothetical protein
MLLSCLAFHSALAQPAAPLTGNYAVTESWSVTTYIGNGEGVVSRTYSGKETGTLAITNGVYDQIYRTSVSGKASARTIYFDGTTYSIDGALPFSGFIGHSLVIKLSFFVIAVPLPSDFGFTLGGSGSSSLYTTGTSLTSLSGSGTYVDAFGEDTTAGFINEVDDSSTSSLTPIAPPGAVAPRITTQPASQTVLLGASPTFSVNATGTAPLSFQWKHDDTNLFDGGEFSGSTNSTLTVSGVDSADAGSYSVVVYNVKDSVASATAVLTIDASVAVQTNEGGKVTPDYNGETLPVGKNYTMTASANPGFLFAGWSGSLTTNTSALAFTLQSNLTLTANFVTNPFLAILGTYNGLFFQTNTSSPVTEQSSGFATITISSTSKGAYSADLKVDGGSYSFSGMFDLNGNSVTNIKRTGKSPLALTLHVDLNLTPPADSITGSIQATDWDGPSGLVADLAYFNSTTLKASNYAGKYTFVLPGSNTPATSPGGYSVAEITNNLAGNSVLTGSLADNTTITSLSTPISKEGYVPIYYSYSPGTSVIFGWLNFTTNPAQTVQGDLTWFKLPTASKRLYSGGFTNQTTINGSLYTPATTNTLITNGTLTIADLAQGISLVYSNVSIISNKLTYATTTNNPLTATITSTTGAISLSFRPAGAKANITAQGVMLQNAPLSPSLNAAGWFLGTNQTGYFILTH